jgi:hypothetical protein
MLASRMTQKANDLTLKPSRKKPLQVTGHAHFAMVELRALESMDGLIKRAPPAARLLVLLVRHLAPGGAGAVVVSRTTMMELLGVSMPTVERALRLLIEEGWVQRLRIGGANALAINNRVAWVGKRGQLRHAVFEATVIASRTEQDAMALNPPPARHVPTVRDGEIPLAVGPGTDPPQQIGLDGIDPPALPAGLAAGEIPD